MFGNIKAANLNAGNLTGDYVYSGRTGQMLHSRVQQNSTDLHYLGYTDYDGYGNLAQQTNHMLTSLGGATEDYTYDKLHRLTQSSITLSGVASNIDYAYDAVGNITKKSDYSANSNNAYTYSNGTNQIAQITLKDNAQGVNIVTFGYDNKGNQTHRNNTREVTYNVFNKPTHIAKNATDITLTYGADLARFKQTRIVDGETITTHYIDKLYEVELKNGKRISKNYISDVAILTHDEETGFTLAFTHRDRLGSAATFTDHNNQVTARRHFDPFGKPRGGDWSQLENLTLAATLGNNPLDGNMDTRRGFTDHEHLDEAEIIHMNGRVYDYNVGRFMSVDPVIQSPENSQSINPYSYIMNNPLSGTDPSGYSACEPTKCKVKVKKINPTGSRTKVSGYKVSGSISHEDGSKTTFSATISNGEFSGTSTTVSANGSNVSSKFTGDMGSQEQISRSDAAGLSNAAYGKSVPPKGWNAVNEEELENDFGLTEDDLNTEEGLNASLFYNKDIYALAYAGTELSSLMDIKADILQNFGFESKQYNQALSIAAIVSSRVGSSGLVFTGHSLGGGLASAASLKTGRLGYTFNAAGLHLNTMGGRIDSVRANRLITAYYAATDPLSYAQDNRWVSYALSVATKLPISFVPATGRRVVVDKASGHSIQSMYDALR